MSHAYLTPGPSRDAVAEMPGPVLLEFGTAWCDHCKRAAPAAAAAVSQFPAVTHIRVEDGPGRPLGRSFRVKLWPTFVFLKDGIEIARLVRPNDPASFQQPLALIA